MSAKEHSWTIQPPRRLINIDKFKEGEYPTIGDAIVAVQSIGRRLTDFNPLSDNKGRIPALLKDGTILLPVRTSASMQLFHHEILLRHLPPRGSHTVGLVTAWIGGTIRYFEDSGVHRMIGGRDMFLSGSGARNRFGDVNFSCTFVSE